jgi:hypothetical protein
MLCLELIVIGCIYRAENLLMLKYSEFNSLLLLHLTWPAALRCDSSLLFRCDSCLLQSTVNDVLARLNGAEGGSGLASTVGLRVRYVFHK